MKRDGYSYEDLRLNKGDPIPADKWNGIVEALPVGLGRTKDFRRVSATQIFFGHPTTAFTTGTTFILDPCDASGVDNGAATLEVFVRQSGTSYTMFSGTNVPTSAIVPFTQLTANYYAMGEPVVAGIVTSGPDLNGCYEVTPQVVWALLAGTLAS